MPEANSPDDREVFLNALDSRSDELAEKAFEVYLRRVPAAKDWTSEQRHSFLTQAKGRFGAILAVVEHGSSVDGALRRDLEKVGADAAVSNSSLSDLMLVLRISRDILLSTALQMAAERNHAWDTLVNGFASRLSNAVDSLIDSLGHGFWTEKISKTEQELDALSDIIERAEFGVYEVDLDGVIRYANPALARITGKEGDLVGKNLSSVLEPYAGGSIQMLFAETQGDIGHRSLNIKNARGAKAEVEITTIVRRSSGRLFGFAGIIDSADSQYGGKAKVDLTPLIRHIHELRRALTILIDGGQVLIDRADEMNTERIAKAGSSIKHQAERIVVIVDELDADRKAISS